MSEPVPTTNFSSSWTRVDQTSDPSFYAKLLEATRAQGLDHARREPDAVFGPLDLRPGLRILDVGCGTGDYLRLMSALVAPGDAVGLDLSEALVTHAQQRTSDDEINVSFRVGDAYSLPFPDACFDRVTLTQVLLHLSDPWAAVKEIRRVLVPDGRLSIAEWDWDSTCLAVTDRELGRRFTHLLCDRMHNGLIVRDLHWRLAELGFAAVDLVPRVRLSFDLDAAYDWLLEPATGELVRLGAFTAKEGARFLDDLRERAAANRYFLARVYYSVIASVAEI